MEEHRFDLRLEVLRKSLAALQLALQQPEDEFIRDSILKRFELAFESARKAMSQWLKDQGEDVGTKKAVMEGALRAGLVNDAELWNEIVQMRNAGSHEYDAEWVVAAVAFVRERAEPALVALLTELEGRA